ncbi:unnamed protein product [Jaminaea pallidilutea]
MTESTHEGPLLFNTTGRWEERWCVVKQGQLQVYAARRDQVASKSPLCSHDLGAFSNVQKSSTWAGPAGPFELTLSRKSGDQPSSPNNPSSSTSPSSASPPSQPHSLPRSATSGSLHSLFERSAASNNRKLEGGSPKSEAPRFQFRIQNDSQTSLNSIQSELGAAPSSVPTGAGSRLSTWLRLPGRSRAGGPGKLGLRAGGSDRSLGDRYQRDAMAETGQDSAIVMRAATATAMSRWAEALAPHLQKMQEAPGSVEVAARPRNVSGPPMLRRRPSACLPSLLVIPIEPLPPQQNDSPILEEDTSGSADISMTDLLLETAGNNARRRRTESNAAEGEEIIARYGRASSVEPSTTAKPASDAHRRRSLVSIAELSRQSISSLPSIPSASPSAAALSLKSIIQSRPGSSKGDRNSIRSERRASSPIAVFNAFSKLAGGTTTSESQPEPEQREVVSGAAVTDEAAPVTAAQPWSRSPPELPQNGSLDEIMGNERRHAMQRFAELRRAGSPSPTIEKSDQLAEQGAEPRRDDTTWLEVGTVASTVRPPLMRSPASAPLAAGSPESRPHVYVSSLTGNDPKAGPPTQIRSRLDAGLTTSSLRPVAAVLPASTSTASIPTIQQPQASHKSGSRLAKRFGLTRGDSGDDQGKPKGNLLSPTMDAHASLSRPIPRRSVSADGDTSKPAMVIVERILPPQEIISRMDAIGKLDAASAAVAKQALLTQGKEEASTASTTQRSAMTPAPTSQKDRAQPVRPPPRTTAAKKALTELDANAVAGQEVLRDELPPRKAAWKRHSTFGVPQTMGSSDAVSRQHSSPTKGQQHRRSSLLLDLGKENARPTSTMLDSRRSSVASTTSKRLSYQSITSFGLNRALTHRNSQHRRSHSIDSQLSRAGSISVSVAGTDGSGADESSLFEDQEDEIAEIFAVTARLRPVRMGRVVRPVSGKLGREWQQQGSSSMSTS